MFEYSAWKAAKKGQSVSSRDLDFSSVCKKRASVYSSVSLRGDKNQTSKTSGILLNCHSSSFLLFITLGHWTDHTLSIRHWTDHTLSIRHWTDHTLSIRHWTDHTLSRSAAVSCNWCALVIYYTYFTILFLVHYRSSSPRLPKATSTPTAGSAPGANSALTIKYQDTEQSKSRGQTTKNLRS